MISQYKILSTIFSDHFGPEPGEQMFTSSVPHGTI